MKESDQFLSDLVPSARATGSMFRIKKIDSMRTTGSFQMKFQEQQNLDDEIRHLKALCDESSEKIVARDKDNFETIGREAVGRYYKHFKSLPRIKEQNHYYKVPDSLYTSMLTKAQNNNLFPYKLGLLKYQGDSETIKLNSMKFGDKQIQVLQEGIKKSSSIQYFELSDNRITSLVSPHLVQSVSKTARKLDLSKNKIGHLGVQHISKSINYRDCKLENLNLEDNKLGNILMTQLCNSLQTNSTVLKLNLSKNFINKSEPIAQLLIQNSTLREIYLHWNQIKDAVNLINAVTINTNLKVLDLSNNILNLQSNIIPLTELFLNNKELVHLDLSFNQFDIPQTQTLSNALSNNHTIFGFHYSGNKGWVDCKGFLIPEEQEEQGQQQLASRINSTLTHSQKRNPARLAKDCCWICEGWQQMEIQCSDTSSDPKFIHFGYQDYEAVYLKFIPALRMVPPGRQLYFFSIGDTQISMPDQPSIKFNHKVNIPNVRLYDSLANITLTQLNYMQHKINKFVFGDNYEPLIQVIPRTKDFVYVPPRKKKQRVIWTFPISLFKDWRKDNEDLLNNCFEFDWNTSRIVKIIKNEEDIAQTKNFMKSIYPYLKDTYKHYASFNPVGDIWSLQSSSFQQFAQATKLSEVGGGQSPKRDSSLIDFSKTSFDEIDEDRLVRQQKAIIKPQDLDLKFIGTLSGTEKGNPRKPDRGMIRFQFLEVLVRIAEEKYLKNSVGNNFCEAVKFLWEDNLEQECKQYNTQSWREERYWNEHCDYCYKYYKQIMDQLYNKFSGKKVKPGQKNFMSLEELIQICTLAGLNQLDHFSSSVPLFSYNYAMMTQVDEVKSDRVFQMSFVEFLEAFARIAEEANLPPYQGAFDEDVSLWNVNKIGKLGLHYKLESMILQAFDNCTDKSFKSIFRKPEKSFFTPVIDSDYE